ncbi:hypothetical protein D9Q98_008427 [Chlorella vulgaris]|uniref:ERD4-related membrane protein n=1 Tax=Chlorella vulgaris TaxID=3077 RepID=A0A9D4YTE3_CHLVU|nr:hypothetical protein D9Q98_008427 [Chlorella vulgaris]
MWQHVAATGQRLLLQAELAPSAEAAAAPGPSTDPTNSTSGYEVSFSSSSCLNTTSPVCYSTAISGENLITGMWVNLILGLLCYLAFVLFRGMRGFEFYHARLLLPTVSRKPPQLALHGHRRLWGWLQPVFTVSDEELVRSAGLDALVGIRIISFGVMLFLPMTLGGMAVLLPINYTSDYYKQIAEEEGMDEYTSVFMRMTISNIRQRSPLLWVHFVFVYLNVFWASWLIIEYYKEYIALRQTYLVRCTSVPGDQRVLRNDSSSSPPLLTPSMGPSRSPMKRAMAVAHSPTRRGGNSNGNHPSTNSSGNNGGSNPFSLFKSSSATVGRTLSRIKLPRRSTSRAGDEFGDFAFRPGSRFGSPSSSPPPGSPTYLNPGCQPREVAGGGSIFRYGPSRFHHSRNNSSPSSTGAAAAAINADGSAIGLAAALAALPQGSPVHRGGQAPQDCSQQQQQQGAFGGGIELATAAAFGSVERRGGGGGGGGGDTSALAAAPAGACEQPLTQQEPATSEASTPGWDAAGGSRARRPLLYDQSVRSSDRHPTESPPAGKGLPPLPAQAAGIMSGGGKAAGAAFEEQGAQQQSPPQQQGSATAEHPVRQLSLSFGRGSVLAELGSLSLRGSGSQCMSDEADTAASKPSQSQTNGGGSGGALSAARLAALAAGDSGSLVSGGSTQALLALAQQPDSATADGSYGSLGLSGLRSAPGDASPTPPGAISRGNGSAAALLPLQQSPGAAVGDGSSPSTADTLPVRPRHAATSSVDVAAALGYDQAPPNAEEIYAAILSRNRAQRDGGDALAAVYCGSGEEAADGSGGGGGGEGIATRWWTSLQRPGDASDMPAVSSLNQSITYKGAVRLAHPPGGGEGGRAQLATNASLFTCLVMDMPLEKLKLRKLGVFPTVWRMIHLEAASASTLTHSCPSGNLLSGGGSGSATPDNGGGRHPEDIAMSLDELEKGRQADADRNDLESHATGLWGVVARLRSLWRNRDRYADWRRDVRWAMYNKRLRSATDLFSELFGSDFDSIIPIYPTASVDKLAHKWDNKTARLERLQCELRDCPRHKPARAVKLKQRIMVLQRQLAELQADIAAERDAVLSDLPSTCFFATFKSQQAAAIASQTNLNPIMQRLFNVQPAPRPDDVNWSALQRSWWQRTLRPLYALPLILFFMLLPIGMFTGAFAQLSVALCGNPNDPATRSGSWYCSDNSWATFMRNALTSLAPSIVLSIYNMVFLPVMVYYAAQMEGQHVSLSALDRRCAHLFFYWDVFNVFLGALFGGTVLAELSTFLQNPAYIWQALGSAIPAASNFFINYVMYRALVMSAFRLFYPHQAIMSSIVKWLRIAPKAKTQRDKLMEVPPRNCRYGRDIGIPVLMNYVMVCSMCITSPLILPFGLLYFAGLWAVWRYQALYVYQRQYESGGQFWPLVAHKVVACQLIMVVFTACVMLFKGGYTQAALLFITLPIFLLRFDNYLTKRYDDLVRQVPLMAVHTAGRSRVPPDIYTPPPLRQGGQGWHPEWGKVWQNWGIGRYTI